MEFKPLINSQFYKFGFFFSNFLLNLIFSLISIHSTLYQLYRVYSTDTWFDKKRNKTNIYIYVDLKYLQFIPSEVVVCLLGEGERYDNYFSARPFKVYSDCSGIYIYNFTELQVSRVIIVLLLQNCFVWCKDHTHQAILTTELLELEGWQLIFYMKLLKGLLGNKNII